jgi:hypothetical protein
MELEFVEPSLFLLQSPPALEQLVAGIHRRGVQAQASGAVRSATAHDRPPIIDTAPVAGPPAVPSFRGHRTAVR